MKVSEDIVAIIRSSSFDGKLLKLQGQLPRDLYQRTAKALEAAGGKWNRRMAAHEFSEDAFAAVEPILLTGCIAAPADFGFFPTPLALAAQLVDRAGVQPGMRVLEPSAGTGRIAMELESRGCLVTCVELQPRLAHELSRRFTTHTGNFLEVKPEDLPAFDCVVLNPPFARQEDIRHVRHALRFLKTGGTLAAIMSASVAFRSNGLAPAFRELVEEMGGEITANPDGAFVESGTAVRTVTVVIRDVGLRKVQPEMEMMMSM